MTPTLTFPRRDYGARMVELKRQVRNAARMGHNDPVKLHAAATEGWTRAQRELREYLAKRNAPVHLRSSEWAEPRRGMIAAEWDAYDCAANLLDRAATRRWARDAIQRLRWAEWFALMLHDYTLVPSLLEGVVLLRWHPAGYRDTGMGGPRGEWHEDSILLPNGATVAEVDRWPRAARNRHWQAKVRQTLKRGGFVRHGRGEWAAA